MIPAGESKVKAGAAKANHGSKRLCARKKVDRSHPVAQDFHDLTGPVMELVEERNMDAVDQFLRQEHIRPRVTKAFYHCLLQACLSRRNNPQAAYWLLAHMESAGLKPTVVTFNCMIGTCTKMGSVAQARKWWDVMLSTGISPNRITYNIVISACSKVSDAKAAQLWMNRMIQEGVKPCMVSFTAVINALAKVGDVESAEMWFARMESMEPDEVADSVLYNAMINACAKAGQVGKAEAWLGRMVQAGVLPDDKTYNCLMHACSRNKDFRRAEQWYEQMLAKNFNPDMITFTTIINCCAKTGELEQATYWVKEMPNHGFSPNIMCYNCLLHACALRADVKKAEHWFQVLVRKGLTPSTISYNCIVKAYLEAGLPDIASDWLLSMAKSRWKADAVTLQLLYKTADQAPVTEDNAGPRVTLAEYVVKSAREGHLEKPKAFFHLLKRLKIEVPEEVQDEIVFAIVDWTEQAAHFGGLQPCRNVTPDSISGASTASSGGLYTACNVPDKVANLFRQMIPGVGDISVEDGMVVLSM